MQYIVQIYAEQHSRCESLNERRVGLIADKESDALHKINDYIYKDTEHKYFGCLKHVLRAVDCLLLSRL